MSAGRETRLCPSVTLPAGKNRPVQGVTHGERPAWCYFYHFHKAQRGMLFPAVDTGPGQFCLQNSAGETSHLAPSRWQAARHDCAVCLGREIPFDILLIMKTRHSFSLDDPWTPITIPRTSGRSCRALSSIHPSITHICSFLKQEGGRCAVTDAVDAF